MSTHTPGPWHIEDASYGQIVCADKADVAVVRNTDGLPHHENARLIAAAPDLLHALNFLLADCEHYEPWARPCHAVRLAREAISKAEGSP